MIDHIPYLTYAKVIAASTGYSVSPLWTFELCYPRFIHSELMTHRVFSRNAASSRAIPVAKMIEQVRTSPAYPIHMGENQKGMQADKELEDSVKSQAYDHWLNAAMQAANLAEQMAAFNVHKQVVNRILEPFMWMKTIVSATEWGNFFELRDHPDAEPNIRYLAVKIKEAMVNIVPTYRRVGEWHLPYVLDSERTLYKTEVLVKMSVARCARVSYLTHDGQHPDINADLGLYDRLAGSTPLHASPLEHQATLNHPKFASSNGNFSRGWVQYRKVVETGRANELF